MVLTVRNATASMENVIGKLLCVVPEDLCSSEYIMEIPGLGKQQNQRVTWCHEQLHETYEDWLWKVWTDEWTFNIAAFGRCVWVFQTPFEMFHPDSVDEKWQFGQKSQIIWVVFCGTLKSDQYFVTVGPRIDLSIYTTVILDLLLIWF